MTAVTTQQIVNELKANNQDFEWYPTTDRMLEAVKTRMPTVTRSIMDIGAGDGRTLVKLAEKCKHTPELYSIEISEVLRNLQPETIIPAGTNFYEQDLMSLPVDVIFCNPPYQQFEMWVETIIRTGFAEHIFLVIPDDWKNSKPIADAIKSRQARTKVIHSDNFLKADRRSRAIIDIVHISFPPAGRWSDQRQDPFDTWFEANFTVMDQPEDVTDPDAGDALTKKFSRRTIGEIVEEYEQERQRFRDNYEAIFHMDGAILNELGVSKNGIRDGIKKKLLGLKTKYWKLVFERLDAITSRLTTATKEKMLEKLTQRTSIEFTANNAYAVVLWAIRNANKYFDEQLLTLFRELSNPENIKNYKSNQKTWSRDYWRWREADHSHFALDYRIISQQYRAIAKPDSYSYDCPNNLHRSCHNLIADIIAVLGNLGFSTISRPTFNREWIGGQWQDWNSADGEIVFQAKAYLNGNMHFRFAPDAIKALNIEAGRLLGWIRGREAAVKELGVTEEEAEKFFGKNMRLPLDGRKLLTAG